MRAWPGTCLRELQRWRYRLFLPTLSLSLSLSLSVFLFPFRSPRRMVALATSALSLSYPNVPPFVPSPIVLFPFRGSVRTRFDANCSPLAWSSAAHFLLARSALREIHPRPRSHDSFVLRPGAICIRMTDRGARVHTHKHKHAHTHTHHTRAYTHWYTRNRNVLRNLTLTLFLSRRSIEKIARTTRRISTRRSNYWQSAFIVYGETRKRKVKLHCNFFFFSTKE